MSDLTNIQPSKQSGFTIVELMIASLLFSVILVVIAMGVMHFSRSYYKGVYSSATQNTARSISEAVSDAVQFGTSPFMPGAAASPTAPGYFCAGGYVFVFHAAKQYKAGGPANSGVYMQPMTSASCAVPSTVSPQRRQLLSDNMWLAYMSASQNATTKMVRINVSVVYGEDADLFTSSPPFGSDVSCKPKSGFEYCASSTMLGTARPRVAK